MLKRKLESPIVVDISQTIEGNQLVTFYRGKKWKTEDLTISGLMKKDLDSYRSDVAVKVEEADDGKQTFKVDESEVIKFIDAYNGIRKKLTGEVRSYGKGSKYWNGFFEAVAIAKKHNLDYTTYINMLVQFYSKMNKESKVKIPWPNQLHGETAQEVILDLIAERSGTAPVEVVARKKAQTKRYLPLEKDEEYQQARAKLKARTFTRADFEYVRTRLIQTTGGEPDWIKRYESILVDREKEAVADDKTI